jgi:hypothetical protein
MGIEKHVCADIWGSIWDNFREKWKGPCGGRSQTMEYHGRISHIWFCDLKIGNTYGFLVRETHGQLLVIINWTAYIIRNPPFHVWYL